MFAHLQTAAKYLKTSLMLIAYWGCRVREADGWNELGFADEDTCRKYLGIPQSTWYKYLRIGEALYNLTFDDLQQITVGNAELLITVDHAIWADYPWVAEAKRLTSDEFAENIVMRNQTAGIEREPMTYVRWKVPYTAKNAIEEMVDSFMSREGLATPGHALEMLVADRFDRMTDVAVIDRACAELHMLAHQLSREYVPADLRIKLALKLRDIRRSLRASSSQEVRETEATDVDEET